MNDERRTTNDERRTNEPTNDERRTNEPTTPMTVTMMTSTMTGTATLTCALDGGVSTCWSLGSFTSCRCKCTLACLVLKCSLRCCASCVSGRLETLATSWLRGRLQAVIATRNKSGKSAVAHTSNRQGQSLGLIARFGWTPPLLLLLSCFCSASSLCLSSRRCYCERILPVSVSLSLLSARLPLVAQTGGVWHASRRRRDGAVAEDVWDSLAAKQLS